MKNYDSLHGEASDLLTIDPGDLGASYSRMLRVLARHTKGSAALFVRYKQIESHIYYDGFRFDDSVPPSLQRDVSSLDGSPTPDSPTLTITYPPPDQLSRFKVFHVDPQLEGTPYKDEVATPFSLHSWVRINVYDGDVFRGQLGCFHLEDDPLCTERDLRPLNALRTPICALVTAIDRAEQNSMGSEALVLLTPTGEVTASSPQAESYLTPERRDRFRHIVRKLERGDVENAVTVNFGLQVSATRLIGGGFSHYVARLTPQPPPLRDPLAALTARQLEIARYAAAGATAIEIARSLELSFHTVKTHLRNVYQRLNIASRIELAELIARFDRSFDD